MTKPLIVSIKQNSEQWQGLDQEAKALQKLIDKANEHKVEVKLVTINEAKSIGIQISKMAHKNNLEFNADQKAVIENDKSNIGLYKLLRIKGQISGKLEDVGNFLSELKNISQGVVDVNKLVVSGDSVDSSLVIGPIELVIYLSNDNENK